MLEPPLPLPPSSRTSQPANPGVPMLAQPIGASEVDGVEESNYGVPATATGTGSTTHSQHEAAPGAAPVRTRVFNRKVSLGSHTRNR